MDTPEIAIIVPYRDRKEHYSIFSEKIHGFLGPWKSIVLYIHQKDTRSFNRGAMKNIGFLVVRSMFPTTYKSVTLVFNDIDSIPRNTQLNYKTESNIVKHFYGYNFTLGGIVSILAEDFERIGGFPNYWGWGYEDNMLQMRCVDANLKIDRSQFYPCGSPNIVRLTETPMRQMNMDDYDEYKRKSDDGWRHIHNLVWTQEGEFIHVEKFKTSREEDMKKQINYNVNNGIHPFSPRGKIRGLFKLDDKRFPSRQPNMAKNTKKQVGKPAGMMGFSRPQFGLNMPNIYKK